MFEKLKKEVSEDFDFGCEKIFCGRFQNEGLQAISKLRCEAGSLHTSRFSCVHLKDDGAPTRRFSLNFDVRGLHPLLRALQALASMHTWELDRSLTP